VHARQFTSGLAHLRLVFTDRDSAPITRRMLIKFGT